MIGEVFDEMLRIRGRKEEPEGQHRSPLFSAFSRVLHSPLEFRRILPTRLDQIHPWIAFRSFPSSVK